MDFVQDGHRFFLHGWLLGEAHTGVSKTECAVFLQNTAHQLGAN